MFWYLLHFTDFELGLKVQRDLLGQIKKQLVKILKEGSLIPFFPLMLLEAEKDPINICKRLLIGSLLASESRSRECWGRIASNRTKEWEYKWEKKQGQKYGVSKDKQLSHHCVSAFRKNTSRFCVWVMTARLTPKSDASWPNQVRAQRLCAAFLPSPHEHSDKLAFSGLAQHFLALFCARLCLSKEADSELWRPKDRPLLKKDRHYLEPGLPWA